MKLRHESTTRQEEKKTPVNRKLFQMQTYEVRVPRIRSYEDPISVKKGDRVFLSGEMDDWDGHIWLWAKASDGRQGWLPSAYFEQWTDWQSCDFSMNTLELTCQIGSVLTAIDEKFGWLLCHSGQGDINHDEKGWVPKRCLTLLGQ